MIKRLLDRPVGTTMTLIAIVILGIVAIGRLPVSLMPDIDIPQITVQVSYPGASAREINSDILKPLKNQLMQVVGLKTITCEARNNTGTIFMTFEPGSNMDILFIGVNEKMDRSVASFPRDMERPKVLKASATDIPAFYLNLSVKENQSVTGNDLPQADTRFMELGSFARDVISKRLEQLPEIAMVDISGVITPELLCVPDHKKLTSMGVGVELLEKAINRNNINLGAISIKDGLFRFNIHFDSKIMTKEDIENIYINHDGRVYQFKELCEVVERPAKRNGLVRNKKENAVTMAIIKQSDCKMEDMQRSMASLIANLEKEYPDVQYELTRDQTTLLAYSISNLQSNLLTGALLACLVIFLFMKDFRSPVLVIITIPLSLIVTLLLFHVTGISINIISLSGLILGIGLMTDNSIIVIDNITQHWQRGLPLKEAIVKGTGEVFVPMLSSVLTTCSVFLPLIFLSGIAGALFYDQAMAVTTALFSSLLVSVLLIPVYFYQLYKNKSALTQNRYLEAVVTFNYYRPYEKTLKWVFRHSTIVLSLFFLTIPAIVLIYSIIDKSRLPDISHNDTLMVIDWNTGISFEENDKRVGELLALVENNTEQSTSLVGIQQFLLSHTQELTPSEALVYIKTKDNKTLREVQQKITSYATGKYPEGIISFRVSGNIFDMLFSENEKKLVAQIQHKDGNPPAVEDIAAITNKIKEKLPQLSIAPLVTEQNLHYKADAEAMVMYDITFDDIYAKMRNMVNQNDLFRINRGGYSVPVTTGESEIESNNILLSRIRNREGVEIPLSLVVEETKGEDFKTLFSGNAGDYYPVYIDAADKDIPHIMDTIEQILKEEGSFFVFFTGDYFLSRSMIRELIVILIVAIALLFFILAAQFESIIQPLIVLSEIVADIFGVLVVLWILGESLNLMSLIGLVVISGIIINDSILKVDTINRLRREGKPLLKAIMQGGHSRLKPILMTSLTTILAIVPFLNRVDMGSDLQYPLSVTIIAGMVIGTFVSLFFIPLAYYLIYKKRK